jgi:glycosyltransferase involved in cell wall biosynthesis
VIYRAHNFESALWEQGIVRSKSPWARWVYRHQFMRVNAFEREIAQTVSWIATVSEEDVTRFKQMAPNANASSVPIGFDFPENNEFDPVHVKAAQFKVLFLGRLDWRPNKQGLIWFLENVWPGIVRKRSNAILAIAGVGDARWLSRYHSLPGVRILGKVDQVEPLYRSCALCVAPIFQGSGTRVKILEAARFARPVLSTALGAEGAGLTPGYSYFQAETPAEWKTQLENLRLEECQVFGERAFQAARDKFDAQTIAENFLHSLQNLHSEGVIPAEPGVSVRRPAETLIVQAG